MNGLLRKDWPWLCTMAFGGALALGMVAASQGFLQLFVMTPGRSEDLFYTAGSMGLFVGAFAGIWDPLLGTREFLRHRPVSSAQLASAPLRAVGLVLLAWTLLVPPVAWVVASFWSGLFEPGHWAGYWEIVAAVAIAWPAAAVGCAAVALPAPWWTRLAFGAAGALVVGFVVRGSQTDGPFADASVYVALCVGLAVPLFWLARDAGRLQADRDAPWTPRTTAIHGGALALTLGLLFAGGALDGQKIALHELQGAYPELSLVGREVVLWRRGEHWRDRVICDAQHAETDAKLSPDNDDRLRFREPRPRSLFEIEAPRWHRHGHIGYDFGLGDGVTLLVDHAGRSWGYLNKERRLFAIHRDGREGEPTFSPGSELEHLEDLDLRATRRRTAFVVDAADGSLWQFDRSKGAFVAFALPGGDRFRRRGYLRLGQDVDLSDSPLLESALRAAPRDDVEYVLGERGAYAIRGGAWVEVQLPPREPSGPAPIEPVVVGDDPVQFVVELPEGDRHAAFRHEFRPRTLAERAHLAHASAWSLLRPPVLQVVAFARSRADDRQPSVFDDHLLLDRSRFWLLTLCVLGALASGWFVRRRLRRLGADAAVVRFWSLVAVVTGVAGVVASVLCVRPRSLRRPTIEPAPPPRIRTETRARTQEVMS
jgi:hypothetical protein